MLCDHIGNKVTVAPLSYTRSGGVGVGSEGTLRSLAVLCVGIPVLGKFLNLPEPQFPHL